MSDSFIKGICLELSNDPGVPRRYRRQGPAPECSDNDSAGPLQGLMGQPGTGASAPTPIPLRSPCASMSVCASVCLGTAWAGV